MHNLTADLREISRAKEVCPGYVGIGSGVRGYWIRGTWVLEPGYVGIGSGVRGY